ncbi:MAG: hypothetical protein H0U64_05365 [Gemmatimonadaceae bacterium]|nr:hypothetical protein [Gemmatimonadaceae bacterium]
MSAEVFKDEWVTVTTATVACGSASYPVPGLTGIRLAEVRETAIAKVLGSACLLAVCNFAVCAVAVESFRIPLLGFLAGGFALLGWAYSWAPPTFYVMLNVSGGEVALVRYANKSAASETLEAIREAMDSWRKN